MMAFVKSGLRRVRFCQGVCRQVGDFDFIVDVFAYVQPGSEDFEHSHSFWTSFLHPTPKRVLKSTGSSFYPQRGGDLVESKDRSWR
jgi:hypothetical protein